MVNSRLRPGGRSAQPPLCPSKFSRPGTGHSPQGTDNGPGAWGSPCMSDIILETEDLTKEFAGFVAVNGVNLRVARGTIHALIGPNGAGKTTCFNLLSKFLSPPRGRIAFDRRYITALQPAEVARLGLVRSFQISA